MDSLYPGIRKPKEIVFVRFHKDDLEAMRELDYFDDVEFYQPEDGPACSGEAGCVETASFIIKFISDDCE